MERTTAASAVQWRKKEKVSSLVVVAEKLLVEQDPSAYFYISQGCLTVENINDQDEMDAVEVCN